jgi:predicted amidophosphoribosyltransferase
MGRCHGCACAQRREKQQEAMNANSAILRDGMRIAVDFALPPRCGGCGTIVAEMHTFCADCWQGVAWCSDNGCHHRGLPLEATDETTCGRCLARPPLIARSRAAMEYGDVAHRVDLIKRVRRTRPLRGMGISQRNREVARAFAIPHREDIEVRHILLVDDVLTSGSTSNACAKALMKADAAQVDLLCFARVVRPSLLTR